MSTRAPSGLGKAGRALWRQVNAEFGLAPHESAILVQCCRVLDRLDALEAELSGAPLTVDGSTGQRRAHPLLAERRHQAQVLEPLSRALSIPLPGEDVGAAGGRRAHGRLRYSDGRVMAWRKAADPFPARRFHEADWPPVDGECLGHYGCHGEGYEDDCVPRRRESCGQACYEMLAREHPDRPDVLAAVKRGRREAWTAAWWTSTFITSSRPTCKQSCRSSR